MNVDLVLYSMHECPGCQEVRSKLAELLLTYVCVNVSRDREKRHQVLAASGQPSVPVLVDHGKVLISEADILLYLDETYGSLTRNA